MRCCEWSEDMSIGVPLLDSDHKTLIGFINYLQQCIDSGDEKLVLCKILDGLITYISFHFSREESVLKACGYSGIEMHKKEHAAFAQHIQDFRVRYARESDSSMMLELLEFLKNWLDHHILVEDLACKKCIEMNKSLANEVAQVFGPGLIDMAKLKGSSKVPDAA